MIALIFSYMNWKDFLEALLNDFRLSTYELAEKTGLTQPTIYRLRTGETEKPTANTIKRIEEGLNIKINDADPKNITYAYSGSNKLNYLERPVKTPAEVKFNDSYEIKEWELPIYGDIPAGIAEFNGYHATETVTLDSRKQFMLRVDKQNGESMVPLLRPGDLVVCELGSKVRPGDIVAAKWGHNQAAIKLYGDNSKLPGTVILESYNRATDLVILNVDKELLTIAKVVHIIKAK